MNADLLRRDMDNRSHQNQVEAQSIQSDYMNGFLASKTEEKVWGLNPGSNFIAQCSFLKPAVEHRLSPPRSVTSSSDSDYKRALMPASIKHALLELFRDVVQVLTENNIRYWITGGTLLGAVRHGDFIPWDDDIDICVDVRDEERLLKAFQFPYSLEYNPLFGYKTYSTRQSSVDLLHLTCYGIFVDFFLMRATECVYQQLYSEARALWPSEYWTASELFPFRSYNFANLQVLGPANPLPYLHRMFSSDCLAYGCIPAVLHGRRISATPLRVPMQLLQRTKGCP